MKSISHWARHIAAVVFAASLASAAVAGSPHYKTMHVFGDSLSDTGNDLAATTAQHMVPAIPPSASPYATYWQGRFSNGPVAVEYLWKLVSGKPNAELVPFVVAGGVDKKSSVNFAFGGAGSGTQNPTPNGFMVPGLVGQVGLYKAALGKKKSDSKALYVVWAGSNDYLQNLGLDPYAVVGNVAGAIRALHDSGARDFLVPNLPDLGATPQVKAQGDSASAQFTTLAKSHNALLSANLDALSRLPGIRIVRLDVYALGEVLLKTGLVNADVPALAFLSPNSGAVDCLFRNPATCVDVTQAGFLAPFLYWDVLHPTTQVHSILGTAMYLALKK